MSYLYINGIYRREQLKDWIGQERVRELDQLLYIAYQLAIGIDYIHSKKSSTRISNPATS
jgi:hypothetical protein